MFFVSIYIYPNFITTTHEFLKKEGFISVLSIISGPSCGATYQIYIKFYRVLCSVY